MRSAFLLGAGLGTRLRPLTENLPKPLIPVGQRPLAAWALDHLAAAGFERCVINTHHCAEVWQRAFPQGRHDSLRLTFRHEPVLLETGGGLKNVEDWLGDDDDLLVYNGDAWTDLPLEKLVTAHRESGRAVTLGLRSSGGPLQVQAAGGVVEDIRGVLGGSQAQSFLFTGVYVVSRRVFSWFKAGEVISVIPVFLDRMKQREEIGGVVVDEGRWMDLGTRETYLEAHRWLAEGYVPGYRSGGQVAGSLISPRAEISKELVQRGFLAAGEGVRVEDGVELEDCVLWPGASVERGSILRRCIVRENRPVSGHWSDHDF